MSRGCRCILVALVGWLSLAAQSPQQRAPEPQAGTDNQVAAALENVAASLNRDNESAQHNQPCDYGRDNRQSDLCAQWKAADAAESTADAAWLFGYIGTFIGLLTLGAAGAAAWYARKAALHTEESAVEARRTANAAERGLRHSESITRAQLRAYLAAEKEVFKMEGARCVLTVHLRNVGQTPAQEVTTHRQMWLIAGRRKAMIVPLPPHRSNMGTLGPKVPIESYNDVHLKAGSARALRAGIATLNLQMVVTFVDAFGDRWKYEQHVWADKNSVETGTVFTKKCQTGPDEQDPQGELALKGGKKSRKKASGKRGKRA